MLWTAKPWELVNHYQRTGETVVTRGVTYYAAIPGCALGSQYVITRSIITTSRNGRVTCHGERWRTGVTLRRWDGSYWTGADMLYAGQPHFATLRECQEWTERRDHRRWARLMAERAKRADENVARGA